MRNTKVAWHGCFPAVVTPFDSEGRIDEVAFRENIRLLVSEGVDGIVIAGCTGESWALTDEEKARLFELGAETASGSIVVIAGCFGLVPSQVVQLGKSAASVGCDGFMVQPPSCSLPSEEEIRAFYRDVAEAVPLPLMVYNIPKRVGVSMSPQFMASLSDLETVVAIKQSSNSFDDLVETCALAGERLRVFAGYSAKRGLPSAVIGVDGYVTSVEPQVMGKEGVSLWRLSTEGKLDEARDVQFRAIKLSRAIWEGKGTFPVPIKAAMNLLGRPGGHPRPPLRPLGSEGTKHLKRILVDLGLLRP